MTPRPLDPFRHCPLSIASTFAAEPHDDPDVFDMICRADTVGVFQIESRAQMSMLPRLRPREFYDLVIEVAIVRPGPIQGKMVHPYLRRRNGEEAVTYPSPEIEAVLKRTLGVPLFQEQAMQLAIVAAGFTPDEADRLRRAMAAWKRKGNLLFQFGQRLIDGMIARGYPPEFAHRCFEQIKGFSEYGFPESHAASFAILVYVSCWLKHYYPAAFAAALINSQPMGFYQPAQIIRDAQEHAVQVLPVDVLHSSWDCTLEDPSRVARRSSSVLPATPALRLGMRLTKGLAQHDAEAIARAAARRPNFTTIDQLRRESGASVGALRCLARADAFASMGISRQAALWAVRSMRDVPMPLFDLRATDRDGSASRSVQPGSESPQTQPDIESLGRESLPVLAPPLHVLHDYAFTGLSLKAHPLSFLRRDLSLRGVTPAIDLRSEALCPSGRTVSIAGIVLVRQRPGTASGVVFITLEDETGIANLIIWPKVFERWRPIARASATLLVRGRVERSGEVVHLHAQTFESLDEHMPTLAAMSRDFH